MSHRLTVTAAAATVTSSLVLYPLVAGAGWLGLGLTAAIVAALAGTLTRLRRIPVPVCLLASAAALLLYLNAAFAGGQSAGRLVPTGASLRRLWSLAGQGMADVHRYAPPVPASRGILLLTATGIGIIAITADLLAVRLRRPALAGLPLLVLFCVPLSTSAAPSPLAAAIVFCLAAAGYLALLSAEGRERVRLWGRLVSAWQPDQAHAVPETGKLAAAGRRIGVMAALLAVVVPVLLPSRPVQRLLGSGTGPGGGPAGQVYLPDPLAVLNQQLHESRPQTVLTYRTTDPSPPYLQVYVLGQLSDNAWTIGRDALAASVPAGPGPLPDPPGLSPGTPGPTVRETISLGRGLTAGSPGLAYLPVPYPARSISVAGSWRAARNSLTVFGSGVKLSGLQYRVTARDVNPSPQELRQTSAAPPSVAAYLPVPRAFSVLAPLARRITAHQDTAYGRAVALQKWFTQTGGFTYSLNVAEPRNASALVDFLTKSKRGYCQQFAFAMAVLARLLGIPSRVVIGYTQGTFAGGDLWRVTTQDAHAWPELYFKGAGWLRFEPTPDGSTGPGQATATPPAYSYPASPATTFPSGPAASSPSTGSTGAGGGSQARQGGPGFKLAPQGQPGGAAPHSTAGQPPATGWLAVVLLGVALATPRSARSLARRRRWLSAAHDGARAGAAWREVTDDLADHGIGCRASESPRTVANRLSASLRLAEAEQAALGRVVTAVERARYAREPAAAATLRADVALIRRAVARSSRRAVRWRARVFPSSALLPARRRLQQLADVLGWLDRLTARPGRRQLRADRRTG